jgi:GNAT superfamily N-acetyltransferase
MAGSEIEVRAATVADRAALVRLLDAQRELHQMDGDAEGVARAVELALSPSSSTWLVVAARSGLVVGALMAHPLVSIEYGGGALWIEELYVEPAHRRRGVARALFAFVADEARRVGLGAIELEVEPSLESALALWGSLGFRPIARQRFDLRL